MTTAVCIRCGEFKTGAFTKCHTCGYQPDTYEDLATSISLSDKYFQLSSLKSISIDIKNGEQKILHPKNLEVLVGELKATISPEMIKAFQKAGESKSNKNRISFQVDTKYEFPIATRSLFNSKNELLTFNSEFISFGEKTFAFSSIDGFTIGSKTTYINGMKTGTSSKIFIRAGTENIKILLGDKLYSKKNFVFFGKIVDALNLTLIPNYAKYLANQIFLQKRVFAISDSIFNTSDILTNQKGIFRIGSTKHRLLYKSLQCRQGSGHVEVFSKDLKDHSLQFSFFDDENACILPFLLKFLKELNLK